jgi:hypothetical protein
MSDRPTPPGVPLTSARAAMTRGRQLVRAAVAGIFTAGGGMVVLVVVCLLAVRAGWLADDDATPPWSAW